MNGCEEEVHHVLPSNGALTFGRSTGGVDGSVVVVVVLVLGGGVVRRSVVHHPALAQYDGTLDHVREVPQLMEYDDDGRPQLGHRGQRPRDRLLADQVDAGVRLVEDHQLRLARQCASDQHPLLLAAGQRGDRVPGVVGEVHRLQRALDGRAVAPAARGRTAGVARAGRRRPPRPRSTGTPWAIDERCGT